MERAGNKIRGLVGLALLASACRGTIESAGAPHPSGNGGAPVGSGDHLKVVMVAGILGDHPDGVTASAIVDESGLRAAIVGRVLAAMETAGAAVRKPATTDDGEAEPNGPELWVRGEADLTTVDLTAAAVRVVCPTCQRPMPRRNTVAVARTGPAAPGHNGDGQRTLAKNELRNLVRDFLAAHPGHEFTPTVIGRELGRSSGAVGNALAKLVISGEAVLIKEAPATFAASDTTPADTTTAAADAAPCHTNHPAPPSTPRAQGQDTPEPPSPSQPIPATGPIHSNRVRTHVRS